MLLYSYEIIRGMFPRLQLRFPKKQYNCRLFEVINEKRPRPPPSLLAIHDLQFEEPHYKESFLHGCTFINGTLPNFSVAWE
jgi:hypothetical protein